MERIRVLLVDDEGDFRNSLLKVLNRRGLEVKGASCGLEALQALEEEGFDVVVLDMMMPGINGLDTLRLIKSRWPRTEVILLTALGSVEMGLKGMQAGAFDYVLKPMDIDELVEKIRQAYERTWLKLDTRCIKNPRDG